MAPKTRRKLSPYNLFVQKHMLAGKSMAQTAKLWKKAGKKAKASPKRVARKASKKKVKRKMAPKRKNTRRRNGFSTAKIFGLLRNFALLGPGLGVALESGANTRDKSQRILEKYSGYNVATHKFNSNLLMDTYKPFFYVSLVTYGIPKIMKLVKGVI